MSNLRWMRLLACVLAIALAACGSEPPRPNGARSDPATLPKGSGPAGQYLVILDLSGSVTPEERDARTASVGRVLRGVSFGDRLALVRVPSDGVRRSAPPVVVEMPVPTVSGAPDADDTLALQATHTTLEPKVRALLAEPPTNGTDLFAALHRAAELVHQTGGRRTTVVVISDMLQCTRTLCIEGDARVPDTAWIAAQKRDQLVPSLGGSCVVVIGADVSTPQGVRVRRFWMEYFRAAGAVLDGTRYVHGITDPALLRCSGR